MNISNSIANIDCILMELNCVPETMKNEAKNHIDALNWSQKFGLKYEGIIYNKPCVDYFLDDKNLMVDILDKL